MPQRSLSADLLRHCFIMYGCNCTAQSLINSLNRFKQVQQPYSIRQQSPQAINMIYLLAATALALDRASQIALANSLQVGRDENPETWGCTGCNAGNKPEMSYIIEQKKHDIKVVLSRYPDCYVLAFRYTNTAVNAWNDILYAVQSEDENTCDGCKIQNAFHKMWHAIEANVTNDLIFAANTQPRPKLIVSGVSLGGALTLIAWTDFRISLAQYYTFELITFGAPRVGNKKWASWVNTNLHGIQRRFEIHNDPIRNLPKCLTLLCNYGNTEKNYLCYDQNKTCVRTALSNAPQFNLRQADEETENLQSIVDHINGYKLLYDHRQVD